MKTIVIKGIFLSLGLGITQSFSYADLPRTNHDLPKDAWVDYRYVKGNLNSSDNIDKQFEATGEEVIEKALEGSDNWAGLLIMNNGPSNIRVNLPVPISPVPLSHFNGNINYGMNFQAGGLNVLSMPAANADMGYEGGFIFHGKKYKDISSSWLMQEMKKTIEGGNTSVPFAYRSAQKVDLPYKEDAVYYAAQSVNGGIIYKYTTDFMFPNQRERAYSIDIIQNNTNDAKAYVMRAIDMYSNYILPSARPADQYLSQTDSVELGQAHYFIPKDYELVSSEVNKKVYKKGASSLTLSYQALEAGENKKDLIKKSLHDMQVLSPIDQNRFLEEEILGNGRYRAMINNDGQVGMYVETLRTGSDLVETWTRMVSSDAIYDLKGQLTSEDFKDQKISYRDMLTTIEVPPAVSLSSEGLEVLENKDKKEEANLSK